MVTVRNGEGRTLTGMHLVETSVFTRLQRSEVRSRLDELPGESLARCVVTDLELGHSSRNEREWDVVQSMLDGFEAVDISSAVVRRAKEVQRVLSAQGLRGRKVPDLLIAAAAEIEGMVVLHYDRDFEIIAGVTGQGHEWILPAGSID